MDKIKAYLKNFIKTRTAGYWIFLSAAILALVGNIIYGVFYTNADMLRNYSPTAFAIPFVAVAISLVVSLFNITGRWAPFVLFGLELTAFCYFVDATYMYLSSVFFAGITSEALASINSGFILTTLFFVIVLVLSIVALFMKQSKENKVLTEPVPAACGEEE